MNRLGLTVDNAASQRLAAVPEALRARLLSAADAMRGALLARIEAALDGEVLQVRSGDLRASLSSTVAAGRNGVLASVSSSSPYAAILEHGGTIPAHEIMPGAGEVLRFHLGGGAGDIFARSVEVPDVHIAGRAFMGRPLAQLSGDVSKAFGGALAQALRV